MRIKKINVIPRHSPTLCYKCWHSYICDLSRCSRGHAIRNKICCYDFERQVPVLKEGMKVHLNGYGMGVVREEEYETLYKIELEEVYDQTIRILYIEKSAIYKHLISIME